MGLGYKDMMISRFMAIIATALLIAASLSLGAVTTAPHALHSHYSAVDSPDHDDCEGAGGQEMNDQGCCQGISCASSGALAQVAVTVPFMLLISQPGPSAVDHLSGRSIAPEPGPPKLLA